MVLGLSTLGPPSPNGPYLRPLFPVDQHSAGFTVLTSIERLEICSQVYAVDLEPSLRLRSYKSREGGNDCNAAVQGLAGPTNFLHPNHFHTVPKALVLYFSISCCTLNINCVVALAVQEHLFDARGNLQNEDVNKTRRRHTGSISHHSEIQSVRVCNCVCVCVCVCV